MALAAVRESNAMNISELLLYATRRPTSVPTAAVPMVVSAPTVVVVMLKGSPFATFVPML